MGAADPYFAIFPMTAGAHFSDCARADRANSWAMGMRSRLVAYA
jgi:hypothetical protein